MSRLGNPLVNEVLIPMASKDYWNSQPPFGDSQFASHVSSPELAGLLPVLYPGVFPNLATFNKTGTPRADLLAILLTGIPTGVVPGFQNYTGARQADMLRLNMAIPASTSPSNLGLIGGDPAGLPQWPTGLRRCGHHRAAGHRRGHPAPRRQDLQARCRRRRHLDRRHLDGTHLRTQRPHGHGDRELPPQLPLPRCTDIGLLGGHLMGTHTVVEAALEPSGEGTVVLDIGGTRGAAIVYTPATLDGLEIEIRRAGRPWDGTHTAVRRRDLRRAVAYAGVFGSLEAGPYQLRLRGGDGGLDDRAVLDLTVVGSRIAELEWPRG